MRNEIDTRNDPDTVPFSPGVQPTGAEQQGASRGWGDSRAGLKWGPRAVWVGVPGEAAQGQ